MYLALKNAKMTVKYLQLFWYQIVVHQNLKLLDFLSDFLLILLLTLNKNLLVGPLNQSIAQSHTNSKSSTGWKFRHVARDNGILTDPLLGLFLSTGRLKSHVILHPFFARDTTDSQKDVLGW